MKRTTIFAEERLLHELKAIARRESRPASELIREALRSYLNRRGRKRAKPGFIDLGASGRKTVAERHESLLWKRDDD